MFVKCKNVLLPKFMGLCLLGIVQFSSASYANCSINTSAMSFSSYNFLAIGNNDSSAQLNIFCDVDTPYRIKMSAGLNAGGDFLQRYMRSAQGSTPLFYNLYLDGSYSQIWGDGQGFSTFYQGLSNGLPLILPLYGRIPGRQLVSPGFYSDSVVITIEW